MSVCAMDDSPWCITGTCVHCDAARDQEAEILLAAFKYRELCDAVQDRWGEFIRTPVQSPARTEAHVRLRQAMQAARDMRTELMEHVLAGRSEVPR